jgi:hypothetical protein
MIFLVSAYYTRGCEHFYSRSTISEGEIGVREPCEEEMLILAL